MEADKVERFTVDVAIVDRDALRAYAMTLNPELDGHEGDEAFLAEVVSNPVTSPLESGYEIRDRRITALASTDGSAPAFRVVTEALVFDGAALAREARRRHKACWGGSAPRMTVGRQLYEVTLASNASPGPLEVGFEILDYDLGEDRVEARREREGRPRVARR